MSYDNVLWGSEGQQYSMTVDKKHPFGTIMKFIDGREFVYARAGGTTDLTAGALQQQAVVVTTDIKDLAVPSAEVVGATSVGVTMQTALTANYYQEGTLFTNTGTGVGYQYKIKSHAAESTGTGEATFVLEEGSALRVAWDTTTKVGLRKHPCDGVVIAPTTETGALVGVAVRAITKAYYCWLQTKGTAVILTNSTVVVGEGVTRGVTTAGSIDAYNEDGAANLLIIGDVMSVGATTEYSLINLKL
uniref:Uncharacterized protein n=1 Tax=viral metagenome TaxID=1070528 RepID=A0A6M3LLU8_9ZZZZ